jgi:3-phosphoshikimate 1-carboxyvinyltransferase
MKVATYMEESLSLPTRVRVGAGQLLSGVPWVPGAKYAAVRAILAAALAGGTSRVTGVPRTDDTSVLLAALGRLGCDITWVGAEEIRVVGVAGHWPVATQGAAVEIDVGNAGAVLRLLLGATATLPEVRFTTAHTASLGQRPNAELLAALRDLGAEAATRDAEGRLPITLRRGALHGGAVRISGARSSQFISALLFLAPQLAAPLDIIITDVLPSASFVRLTIAMLAQAGIAVEANAELHHLHIPAPQAFLARDWQLPRDDPSAAVWLVAGAVAGDVLTLMNLPRATEDGVAVRAALRALGADIAEVLASEADQVTLVVRGGAPLHGAAIDGAALIDSVPVVAAAACFAEGTTVIHNVGALRLKESNRIDDLCLELHRTGAHAIAGPESVTIIGQPAGIAGGATVDAHHDHRLAMALSIVALRAHAPLTITGADHVAKSYPAFWRELARLGADVTSE